MIAGSVKPIQLRIFSMEIGTETSDKVLNDNVTEITMQRVSRTSMVCIGCKLLSPSCDRELLSSCPHRKSKGHTTGA
jgi:hypothetical protein